MTQTELRKLIQTSIQECKLPGYALDTSDQEYLNNLFQNIDGTYTEKTCMYLNTKFNTMRFTQDWDGGLLKIFDDIEEVFNFDNVNDTLFYTSLKTFILNYELLLKLELLEEV